jgi:hypothetical protein
MCHDGSDRKRKCDKHDLSALPDDVHSVSRLEGIHDFSLSFLRSLHGFKSSGNPPWSRQAGRQLDGETMSV